MMKEKYENPEIEIVVFSAEDIITSSPCPVFIEEGGNHTD